MPTVTAARIMGRGNEWRGCEKDLFGRATYSDTDGGEEEMSVIPQKKYYKISEVSRLTGLESHVLRFWEGEFSAIRPKRTESGQRMYRRKDIDVILEIKRLLHDERYTIEGAKKMIGARGKEKEHSVGGTHELLKAVVEELRSIRAMV